MKKTDEGNTGPRKVDTRGVVSRESREARGEGRGQAGGKKEREERKRTKPPVAPPVALTGDSLDKHSTGAAARLPTFIPRRTRFVIFKAELVETPADRRPLRLAASLFPPTSRAISFSTFPRPFSSFFNPFFFSPRLRILPSSSLC